ncbi:hypothetical protein B0A48_04128 [Cryoendolithus antarcticus]|uniref:Uncharacterized protein n=1 Tax=Cryoendolithus antarcticus TaxID=1507870 RepID=A0A1V8THG4_9PEZI|nr:hypothetical protein B0A48_04128 [Cryoendolithus antarcticus]
MPSRKSQSGEAPPTTDSRRSSMKRLSSTASLHALNPFHRRRSNNASDISHASSSSNVSLQASTSATTLTPSNSLKPSGSSQQNPSDLSPLVENAPPPTQASYLRRSSYICLPDDPIGGMPRSRTFSALPLPTRGKKASPRTPSISHGRNTSGLIPDTRLPTPPASTRRHISGGLPVTMSRGQNMRVRMKRSDTMPLLSMNADQVSNVSRSTAFKENVAASPTRPALDASAFDEPKSSFSLPPGSYIEDHDWESDTLTALPRHPNFSGSLPLSRYTTNENVGAVQTMQAPVHHSSPAHHVNKSRLPLGASFARPPLAQRWNSQPVLTNTTNVYPVRTSSILPSRTASTHRHEIRETRLMSARGAPTPPPIASSLSTNNLTSLRSSVGSFSHVRQPSTTSLLNTLSSPPQPLSAYHVTDAEPTAYWAGRISSLLDRYRNDDLAATIMPALNRGGSNALATPPKAETDKLHTPAAATARMRKALETLHGHCVTDEARESFVKFQMQYAAVQNLPELSRAIRRDPTAGSVTLVASGKGPTHARKKSEPLLGHKGTRSFGRSLGKAGDGVEGADAKEMSAKEGARKISFFDRVLGRKEKRESLG